MTVSVAANVAGGHSAVERAAHAWPVLAYLAGELLANRVRAYAVRLHAAETPEAAPQITPADVQAAVHAAIAQTLAQAATATQAAIAATEQSTRAAVLAEIEAERKRQDRRDRAAARKAEQLRPVSPATVNEIESAYPAPVSAYEPAYL